MKNIKIILLLSLMVFGFSIITSFSKADGEKTQSVYDFKVNTIDGDEISLSEYKGKVLLIVNVASECGFTGQYEGLQKLYEEYKDKDFVVLGFPCNQFGKQEPGSSEEIKTFCSTEFGVTFPMFEKIDVNGESAHPLYDYLKSSVPGDSDGKDIKWNFTKFLIGKDGRVVARFSTTVKPKNIKEDIEKLISK